MNVEHWNAEAVVEVLERWTTAIGRPSARWVACEPRLYVTTFEVELVVRGAPLVARAAVSIAGDPLAGFAAAVNVSREDARAEVFTVLVSSRALDHVLGVFEAALPGLVRA